MEKLEYIKGPSFYKEEDLDIFWGRDEEIQDLYYLVSNSDFSICYARSGEGKTSLLNAGLIPMLRKSNFLPVCVRFTPDNYKDNNPDFDSWVANLIENTRKTVSANDYKSVDINDKGGLSDTKDLHNTLWWKLRVNEIRKDAFVQLTPILIFDQFEEVFTCSENIEWVNKFFAWLESLYNDMNPLDDANVGRLPKKFKVLLSLRSEYVCELDYWSMQRYFIPSLKNNRYYLKALTGNNAEKIADKILDRADLDNISKDDVLRFSQNEDTDKSYKDKPCKSALKLSLILDTCYRYNEKVKELINEKGNTLSLSDILEIYYDEATKDLTRKQRDKIEDLLVDSRGRRNKVSQGELASVLDEYQQNILKEKRIITDVNAHEVEIAHDCMCEIIFKHSNERRKAIEYERNIAIKNKWFVIVSVILSFCAVASFFLFRQYAYLEIKEHYLLTKSIGNAWLYVLLCKAKVLLFLPYLLPLAAIGVFCRVKGTVKDYVKPTDILTVVFGTLSVFAACFLHDSIFSDVIGQPDMSDSIWYVVIPILIYLSCVFYSWEKLRKGLKLMACFLCFILLFPIIEYFNVFFNIFIIGGLGLVSIGLLVATFKKLSMKGCIFCVTINVLVLAGSLIAHLGCCPWKVLYYSEVKYSKPWKYIFIEKEHRYGALDATTGDTIVPCLFDGITRDGFVMLLSPTCEEMSDSLLEATDTKSIIEKLKERGEYAQLNNKNGIRYVWNADKRLYDISKKDTVYKGKAAKAYFAVRDDLYKAIKQNTSINKIDTTALMTLYQMEKDSINNLCDNLRDSSDVYRAELLITHTARQMAIATMIDMINDNRSKYSLLIAFSSYKLSYFSKEFCDENMSFHANIKLNINEEIKNDTLKTDEIMKKKECKDYLSWGAKFSNNDFSMLGVLSLWQYVYVNTMSLTAPLYKFYLEKNLQSMIDEVLQPQIRVIEKLSKSISFDSKDVDKVIADIDTGKDLAESISNIVSQKYSGRISLVDSLASINDKYKSFSPFSFFNNKSLKNVRNTACENIQIFYTLYDCCSNRDDYHYAIFRQKMIDNLHLASFCGSDIINDVNCLEVKDSTFFNQTYEYMRNIIKKVNKIRENAKKWEDIDLREIKKILQRNSNYHK